MTKHFCVDRILTKHLSGVSRAISPIGKLWVLGSTLRIKFMEGTASQKALVKQYAPEWTQYANLKFQFSDDADSEIRITFDPSDGAWSYIGTDCKGIPHNEATMNLGWQDAQVIRHEFGHAVSLGHEHQSPFGTGIRWNEAAVIRDLSGSPNFWSEQQIRDNVIQKYTTTQVNGTTYDPLSIMEYAFPAEWTLDGIEVKGNETLSAQDRLFVASSKMYPGLGAVTPVGPTPLTITTKAAKKLTAGSIGVPGEQDLYGFTVVNGGTHTIETSGTTDVFLKLFGPNSDTHLLAQNDDGGVGTNARIVRSLPPGNYIAQVTHYSRQATGKYSISVVR
jgi:astacin (peptidase family M12A)/pre-peptidase